MKTEQETEKGKSTFRCGGHLIDLCTLADRCLVIQPKKYITYTTIMVSVNRILYNLQRCKKKEKLPTLSQRALLLREVLATEGS